MDASRRPFLLCLLARLASLLFLGLRVSLGALSRLALAMAASCYGRMLLLVRDCAAASQRAAGCAAAPWRQRVAAAAVAAAAVAERMHAGVHMLLQESRASGAAKGATRGRELGSRAASTRRGGGALTWRGWRAIHKIQVSSEACWQRSRTSRCSLPKGASGGCCSGLPSPHNCTSDTTQQRKRGKRTEDGARHLHEPHRPPRCRRPLAAEAQPALWVPLPP